MNIEKNNADEINIVTYWHKQVNKYKDRPAYRFKKNGLWVERSWQEYGQKAEDFAIGLMVLGIKPGEVVAILGSTREEWDLADRATLAIGGIAVGVYHSNTPEQIRYIIDHSTAKIVVVENMEQWQKIKKIRSHLSAVKRFILMEPWPDLVDAKVMSFEAVQGLGKKNKEDHQKEYRHRGQQIRMSDPAIYVYTSGTTGPPKGAILTHKNIMAIMDCFVEMEIFVPEEDRTVAWLPLPHVFGRFVILSSIYNAHIWSYAGAIETLIEDLADIKPTIFHSVPRIYEKIHHKMVSSIEQASPLKRIIFNFCMDIGREVSRYKQDKKPLSNTLKIKYAIADRLLFQKLRGFFGGSIHSAITGGAPLSMEILEFFHAAGIVILEGYGLTESPSATFNRQKEFKFGTVGPPVPGMEIKIADDGELLLRSPIIFAGYLKDPEKTKETFNDDGWYCTGDIGIQSPEGFISITDRKKDIIITAGGKNVAPQNIENLLKSSPFISQAMVYGDRKPYLTALITIDREELEAWAKEMNSQEASYAELCRSQHLHDFMAEIINKINQHLASYETIKKFTILSQDFSEETGEITPTLKVKRRFVSEKYKNLLEEMYT